ncbi:tubulin polyglutamylase TTLL5 isoform X1 [Octopus bimaculoides]|uniref:tubulin polyglutamylase TTLL5 isoform X1 n=2 Tax=Octopus bimaculoides TaxID=37653 RepID=UPI00071D5E90|nr:tubulin polyglutamylase TTLL5 isoform X1 [Octopus bimaculoides]XP_014776622.1 tubulin polyglutamylase TTLL5 isoform X1 [Octopus bimaculoides]XP_014776623.1 tubulin polyglutamylase TTLL5 isoform X1 [Octopus bimaculoides]XP_052824931.1 tubulin polyglutamylase TTLL5 isoform X1 [Octopus bimaculoides]XP_052824932.1 tubulin polyglutamylase TTLL5 isoform X1 [Octopus bimaculoides]XP_052824934.1 tubulin polyglutamylase TTLL5 isoform X1 [Octopus bimaculoides]|eukprot:XP_014776621.1 PREDICTED: tubulin polyglutamylase TTLL5-like isoform X1 [Octopus bimaculoides]
MNTAAANMEDEAEVKMAEDSNKVVESDGEPMTPSDHSDADHESNTSDRDDSDYQSEDQEISDDDDKPNIRWTGYNKKIPVLIFHPEAVLQNKCRYKKVGERFHMAFKFGSTESRIIRTVLLAHGFHEVTSNHSDYNILWTGGHLKPLTLRNMADFQKINHFPRSYELTRKDKLYKNVQRMQQMKGCRNFNFVPMSFVIPSEYQEFCCSFCKDRGPWIIKPVASSRGRGVHLVSHPEQVPFDEHLIVSKYIQNPLLIDGFKFDIRLYVAVTSYDPLVVYLYEEGLTRFATVRYDKSQRSLKNQCMHLTNYSVNKKSDSYVKNDDPDIEDYGNKWSLGALLRYLKAKGTDTAAMMMKIEDVVVKTILSAELHIAAASKMFINNKWNCFELYGFDVLIDDTLKPWILEVNLSPSLVCDSPLDLKIKTNLICDLFSAIGIVCHDPMVKNYQQIRKNMELAAQMNSGKNKQRRPASAGASASNQAASYSNSRYLRRSMSGLNSEEIKIVRRVREEESRKGGWIRLFPSPDSWDLYSPFLQFSTTHNLMLHQRLYPQRHKAMMYKCLTPINSLAARAKSLYNNLTNSVSNLSKFENENCESFILAQSRAQQYERRLDDRRKASAIGKGEKKKRRRKRHSVTIRSNVAAHSPKSREESSSPSKKPISPLDKAKPYYYCSLEGLEKTALHRSAQQMCTLQNGVDQPTGDAVPNQADQVASDKSVSDKAASNKATSNKATSNKATSNKATSNKAMSDMTMKQNANCLNKGQLPDKHKLVLILQNGGNLSQLQARTAFALYLTKVQQRLVAEANSNEPSDVDSLTEQMDLVIRFLKRAAANLQRNFQVIAPSKKLAVKDRCRVLAKELSEFVRHYKKETHQFKKLLHNEPEKASPGINDEEFNNFMSTSDENELELVLTTYTKLRKSGSIFLGNCCTGDGAASHNQAGDRDNKPPKVFCPGDSNQGQRQTKSSQHRLAKPTMLPRNTPQTPKSPCLPSAGSDTSVETHEEKTVKEALQSLTKKQQLRQYSAKEGSRVLSQVSNAKPGAFNIHNRSRSLDRKCKTPPILLHSASSSQSVNQNLKTPEENLNFVKVFCARPSSSNRSKSHLRLSPDSPSPPTLNKCPSDSPKTVTALCCQLANNHLTKHSLSLTGSCPHLAVSNGHKDDPLQQLIPNQKLSASTASSASDLTSGSSDWSVVDPHADVKVNQGLKKPDFPKKYVSDTEDLEFKFFQKQNHKPKILKQNVIRARKSTHPTLPTVSPKMQQSKSPFLKIGVPGQLYKADSCTIVPSNNAKKCEQKVQKVRCISCRHSTL